MDAAPALSVHWNEYLAKYLAVYSNQLANTISIRTADQPEGPWQDFRTRKDRSIKTRSDIGWEYEL
jgi:hypothetical protein